MPSKSLLFLSAFAILSTLSVQAASPSDSLSDDAIRNLLAYRCDEQRQATGIVVGIRSPSGRRVIAYGDLGQRDKQVASGDVVFGIGGVSEVFTALLLSEMAQRGEVALTAPVGQFLPKTVSMPMQGRPITLQDLATHTSGLPRYPANISPKNPANPFAGYTDKDLYSFLADFHLPHDVGTEFEYSNVGVALLGHALSLKAHKPYETLLKSRITARLGMNSTGITLPPAMASRLAAGHDATLQNVPNWDFQLFAPAGGVRSTANDLLTLLDAALGYSKSPLTPALEGLLKVRKPTTWNELENALGWQVCVLDRNEIVRKDGKTFGDSFGYGSFIGYDPQSRTGVVVLSNASSTMGVDDIGLYLLDNRYPLRGKRQKEATVDPRLFQGYVGSYQLSENVTIKITTEGNHLFAQVAEAVKYEIFPQNDRNYFYKVFDAQFTFEPDSQGQATALIMHYNGRHQRAKRIDASRSTSSSQ